MSSSSSSQSGEDKENKEVDPLQRLESEEEEVDMISEYVKRAMSSTFRVVLKSYDDVFAADSESTTEGEFPKEVEYDPHDPESELPVTAWQLSSFMRPDWCSFVTDSDFDVLLTESMKGLLNANSSCPSLEFQQHGLLNDAKGNRYLVFSRAWERARPKFDFSQRLNVTTTKAKDNKRRANREAGSEFYDSFDPFFSCDVSPLETLMTASHANYYVCVKLPSKNDQ